MTGILFENTKWFDTNLELTISYLANGRAIYKFNSVLVKNNFSSLNSNCISNLYIVCKLNTWLGYQTNNFTLKNCLFGTVKLTRNTEKSRFTYNGGGTPFDRNF